MSKALRQIVFMSFMSVLSWSLAGNAFFHTHREGLLCAERRQILGAEAVELPPPCQDGHEEGKI